MAEVKSIVTSSLFYCDQTHCYDALNSMVFLEREFPRIQFETLLRAIQKSKLLERFSIGSIQTHSSSCRP